MRELIQHFGDFIRQNPPESQVTNRQWSSTEIIYSQLQTSVRILLISSQKKSFLAMPNHGRKRMLNFVWNTWKYWWNETDDEVLPVFA